MATPDPTREITLRLERAAQHLAEIARDITAYQQSRPYTLDFHAVNLQVLQAAQQFGQQLPPNFTLPIVIDDVCPLPESVPVLVSEYVHHLRASLDHLAYLLVLRHGQQPLPANWEKLTYFPAKDRPPRASSSLLQPYTTAAIESDLDMFQPYNQSLQAYELRRLNEYSNQDKHRFLQVPLTFTGKGNTVVTFADGSTLEAPYKGIYVSRDNEWQQTI